MKPVHPPLVVPITVHAEFEQLLRQYRSVLERIDGKADTDRFTDADLIAIAARVYMREVIKEGAK